MTTRTNSARKPAARFGADLTSDDLTALARLGISGELAKKAGLLRLTSAEAHKVLVTASKRRDLAGIMFPYWFPKKRDAEHVRVRVDNPVIEQQGELEVVKGKYFATKGKNRLYFGPRPDWKVLQDTSVPIAIADGEKRALALQALARHGQQKGKLRFLPLGLPGAWGWRVWSERLKKGAGRLQAESVAKPIKDLDLVDWKGRSVYLVFDGAGEHEASVAHAAHGLSKELERRGANVTVIEIPPEAVVCGIDELLGAWGVDRVLELFEAAQQRSALSFEETPDGIVGLKPQKDGEVTRFPVTNFRARIIAEIFKDDGAESKRFFRIEARIGQETISIVIPAADFDDMRWPSKALGAAAVVYPHRREYARAAIQLLSGQPGRETIFTHLGWTRFNGQPVYLHAAGAIGKDGPVPGVQVEVSEALANYVLPSPPSDPTQLAAAVRASLKLLTVVPDRISLPVFAAIWRSVLCPSPLSLLLAGRTGVGKTELAARAQQHFGPAMDASKIPASWISTSNALEGIAFEAKDALLVIDDFAPHGNISDIRRMHAAADRLLRAQANRAGRMRMKPDATLNAAKPPRGLILTTGEDVPEGQSLQSRIVILEMRPGDMNFSRLGECQADGAAGLYAQAMAAFLEWLAAHHGGVGRLLQSELDAVRAEGSGGFPHARVPTNIAHLIAGFRFFLRFAQDVGVLVESEASDRLSRAHKVMDEIVRTQVHYQISSDPVERFRELLSAALASGKAHVAGRDGDEPTDHQAWGWRTSMGLAVSQGARIGWIDEDHLYLDPEASHAAAQALAQQAGEPLPIPSKTLRKRLRDKGLLLSTDEGRRTLTVRRKLEGAQRDVLHLSASWLRPKEDEVPGVPDRVSGVMSGLEEVIRQ